jgi:hypothetical protein
MILNNGIWDIHGVYGYTSFLVKPILLSRKVSPSLSFLWPSGEIHYFSWWNLAISMFLSILESSKILFLFFPRSKNPSFTHWTYFHHLPPNLPNVQSSLAQKLHSNHSSRARTRRRQELLCTKLHAGRFALDANDLWKTEISPVKRLVYIYNILWWKIIWIYIYIYYYIA